MVSFYQCLAAVPSVFDVVPPVGLEAYSRWIDLFTLPSELENLFVPTACLGDYNTRIWLGSSWPIGLVLLFAVGFICWQLLLDRRKAHTVRSVLTSIGTGLQRVLPLVLGLTFLVVPSVSMRIFRTFLCEPIKYSEGEVRRYLKADLTLSCDAADYEEARNSAFMFIAVWPVGIPLLYAVLLWANRRELVKDNPTLLTQATAFLWGDYKGNAFYFEPLEMCRKLILVGWVLVIRDEAEQARVLVALFVSITFFGFRLTLRPLKRYAESGYSRFEPSCLWACVDLNRAR
eukprot:2511345-Prymnesium_polylepis.1